MNTVKERYYNRQEILYGWMETRLESTHVMVMLKLKQNTAIYGHIQSNAGLFFPGLDVYATNL